MKRRTVVAASLGAWLGTAARAAEDEDDAPAAIAKWPALRQLDGSVLPAAAWKDTAAILVFWATWCPFCREHNVHVQALHRQGLPPGVRLQTFAIDGTAQSVGKYMQAKGWDFPVSLDAAPLRAQLRLRKVVPTTCTIDAKGRLLQAISGEMLAEDFMALPRSLTARRS